MKTRSIPITFRKQAFISAIEHARDEMNLNVRDVEDLADYGGYADFARKAGKTMLMDNFLKLCNLFDLDPRDFFELAP